jgi:hypothetical protein
MRTFRWLAVVGAMVGAATIGACSSTQQSLECSFQTEGCPCTPGTEAACADTLDRSADQLTCAVGTRTCGADGKWGACAHQRIGYMSVGPTDQNGIRPLGPGVPTPCTDNPCNPNCVGITDTPDGLDPGDGGARITDAGISIQPGDASKQDAGACVNLQCLVAKCDGGASTTLTGTVYDPAGLNPIYNATVYVPNAPLPPFPNGVGVETCSAQSTAIAVTTTTTGPDGKFTLTGVPSGSNIPLVVQVGRWRRAVTIPSVTSCVSQAVSPTLTRLPRNKSEGDMPQMAIATGSADPFECLLLKMGISASEFVPGANISNYANTGRVHVYRANGAKLASGSTPAASTWWDSPARWSQYNIAFLPCEGSELDKTSTQDTNLLNYANAGGRIFPTHYSYTWLRMGPAPFQTVVNWNTGNQFSISDPLTAYVDNTFPKGQAYQQWLINVGASPTPGRVSLREPRWNVNTTSANAQRWLYGWSNNGTSGSPNTVQALTFNTPVGAPPANQVGRVAFTSYHVSANAICNSSADFPNRCCTGALTAQEKALEFMVFDVSSCVEPDVPPPPPTPPYTKPAVFVRDYQAVCPSEKRAVWRWWQFKTTTPADSSIAFSAQTADTSGALAAAPSVSLATVSGAPIVTWTGVDVNPKLPGQLSKAWLRITMTLNPSSDGYSAPTVNAWQQLYDCIDAQ